MFRALEQGLPFFVDEFDTMLHPLIVESLFKLFQSEKTNPRHAQLIVSSHAVYALTDKLFRRDQIRFCEKDRTGASGFYSLVEYREHVRKDASFGKNYLQGKYGAIPFLQQRCLHLGADG
jgi:AAA15 family ATPase/GTPase